MKVENQILKDQVADFQKQMAEFESLQQRFESTMVELNDHKEKVLELSQDLASERQFAHENAEKAALADQLELEMARRVEEASVKAAEKAGSENNLLQERVAQLEAQLQEKTAGLEEHESIIKSLKIEIQDIQLQTNLEPTLQSLSAKSSSEDAVRCADTSTLSFFTFSVELTLSLDSIFHSHIDI